MSTARVSGEAQVVAGEGMHVSYDYHLDALGQVTEYQGELLRMADAVYYRTSVEALPEGKSWFEAAESGYDLLHDAFAFVDPLFVLAAGYEAAASGNGVPTTLHGREVVRYDDQWHFRLAKPAGPIVTVIDRYDLQVIIGELWVDPAGQLVRVQYQSDTYTNPMVSFWVTVTYRDFGAPVTLSEPDPDTVVVAEP
jgi:hypothetical protein